MDEGRGGGGPTLEPSEQRVLELMAEGLSNRQVAGRLGMPVEEVHAALGAIRAKLGAGSKLEALIVAFRRGLIRLPPA